MQDFRRLVLKYAVKADLSHSSVRSILQYQHLQNFVKTGQTAFSLLTFLFYGDSKVVPKTACDPENCLKADHVH